MPAFTPSKQDIEREAFERLRSRFPDEWVVSLEPGDDRVSSLIIRAPKAPEARVLIVVRPTLRSSQVAEVAETLRQAAERLGPEATPAAKMVVARYISPPVREALDARQISYADIVGNVNLNVREPGMLIVGITAESSDPWRAPERSSTSLRGLPARRVVRALVDRTPPWGVRELATYAGASLASTSRTVDLLETEGLIERGNRREVVDVRWADLLLRWSDDYDPLIGRRGSTRLDPRGALAAAQRLKQRRSDIGPFAISGSLAARRYVTVAEPKMAMIFVADLNRAIDALDLDFSPDNGNVMLIESLDDAPLLRAIEADSLPYTAASQTFADLKTAPGRTQQEADAFLEWMQTHQSDWRARP